METLISLLDKLNALTPLGVIALLGLAIFIIVWRNPLRPIESKLSEVTDNHLHSLPDIADNVEKAVEVLQRIEIKMAEEFSYLRAKVNNK